MNNMRVWTCVDHEGMWVGVASVVVAATEDEARALLADALPRHGLRKQQPFTLQPLSLDVPQALILQDGDY